jgi:hypothetical protein
MRKGADPLAKVGSSGCCLSVLLLSMRCHSEFGWPVTFERGDGHGLHKLAVGAKS